MSHPDRVVDLLRQALERRERDRAPVRAARVLGRHEDGTERLLRLDAVCVTRGTTSNNYAGSVITAPAVNPVHRTGSTGVATVTDTAVVETLWIDSLDSSDLRPGQSYTITVTGRGFDARTRIDFLDPEPGVGYVGQTINRDITVTSIEVLDPGTLVLHVDVAPDARLWPGGAPIAYGRA